MHGCCTAARQSGETMFSLRRAGNALGPGVPKHKASAISPLVVLGVGNGQKAPLAVRAMGREDSDAPRSVLEDLIGHGLSRPDLPDSLPANPTMPVSEHIRGATPATVGIRPYRCMLPLRDKDVFGTHLGCAAPPKRTITAADRGTMGPGNALPPARNPGLFREIPVLPAPVTAGSD